MVRKGIIDICGCLRSNESGYYQRCWKTSEDGLSHYEQDGCFWTGRTNPTVTQGIGSPRRSGTRAKAFDGANGVIIMAYHTTYAKAK